MVRAAAKKWGVDAERVLGASSTRCITTAQRPFHRLQPSAAVTPARWPVPADAPRSWPRSRRPTSGGSSARRGDAVRRRQGHGHRQGGLRRRRRAPRHADGHDRALPGGQRRGEVASTRPRRCRCRASKVVEPVLPPGVSQAGGVGAGFIAARRRRRPGREHLGRVAGRRALKPTIEWDLGPATPPTIRRLSRRARSVDRRQPGKTLRQKGDVDAAFAQAAEGRGGRLLRPPPGPGADGASRGRRPLRERAAGRSGPPPRVRSSRSTTSGLAMLEPDPVKWLLWQATEPCEM